MDNNFEDASMPIGFAMALAQNAEAMNNFSRMDISEQDEILLQARNVTSRAEMQQLVASLADNPPLYTGKIDRNGYGLM